MISYYVTMVTYLFIIHKIKETKTKTNKSRKINKIKEKEKEKVRVQAYYDNSMEFPYKLFYFIYYRPWSVYMLQPTYSKVYILSIKLIYYCYTI